MEPAVSERERGSGDAEARRRPGVLRRLVSGWRLNLLLLLATVLTTWLAGGGLADPVAGAVYAGALLGILVTHEMGHFVTARRYGVEVSLPYFIPVPFAIGTFGAIIKMDERIPDRRALVVIGAAGPIAGMVVAVPLLVWGLSHSVVAPTVAGPGLTDGGALAIVSGLVSGELDTAGLSQIIVEGDSVLYWSLKHLLLDLPPGHDVWIHPVAWAGWLGLFVTALNLLPVGQLDGGHVLYGLLGDRSRSLGDVVRGVLLGLGLMTWVGWLLWVLLIGWSLRLTGGRHPPTLDDARPLSRRVRWTGVFALLLLALTFAPAPLRVVTLTAGELRALPGETLETLGLCEARLDWAEAVERGADPGPPPDCPPAAAAPADQNAAMPTE